MPTYSYKCKECGNVFDAFHSMSCTDEQHCPECHGVGQKLLSASSVIFKGSGFYSTDYRDSGYLEAKKKDNENASAKESAGSSDSKSETKSEAKSDSKKNSSASGNAKTAAISSNVAAAA
ncbi:MAG: zinc ribbon domain-containing protein [Candidatus Rifleibacteriota bacterium]